MLPYFLPRRSEPQRRQKFSKVSSMVILYGKSSCMLTFGEFYLVFCRVARRCRGSEILVYQLDNGYPKGSRLVTHINIHPHTEFDNGYPKVSWIMGIPKTPEGSRLVTPTHMHTYTHTYTHALWHTNTCTHTHIHIIWIMGIPKVSHL